jgi:hypothetical protein
MLATGFHELRSPLSRGFVATDLPEPERTRVLLVFFAASAVVVVATVLLLMRSAGWIGLIYAVRVGRPVYVGIPSRLLIGRGIKVEPGGVLEVSARHKVPFPYAPTVVFVWTFSANGKTRRLTSPVPPSEAHFAHRPDIVSVVFN